LEWNAHALASDLQTIPANSSNFVKPGKTIQPIQQSKAPTTPPQGELQRHLTESSITNIGRYINPAN
jgi:hypothetical protein